MSWVDQLYSMVASQAILASLSPTESKRLSSSSHNGALQNSENLTGHTGPALCVKEEATPYTGGMALPYANPLGAIDASDWELYQGCKMPTVNDTCAHDAEGCEELGPTGYVCTLSRGHDGDHVAEPFETWPQDDPSRQEAQASTYKQLYGLPTDDKARKRLQIWTYLLEYFPDAFLATVEVAVAGNEQHNPGQPLHWAREKSTDQMNTAFRHQFDYGRGVKKDTDGQWHLAKAIWRLSAQLQLDIEAERRQNGDK